VARRVDHRRRAELLEDAVDYTISEGIADLSLRPIATALGVTPTTLVHHFGAKEALLESILNRVRERIFDVVHVPHRSGEDAVSLIRDVWTWTSAPEHQALFRLFFAVYGRSLQEPDHFKPFRSRVVDDWLTLLADGFERDGYEPVSARAHAGLALAVIRGLLLDLLTTGDEVRTGRALEEFIRGYTSRDGTAGEAP
jgi:AcrR family transcriptional regulator